MFKAGRGGRERRKKGGERREEEKEDREGRRREKEKGERDGEKEGRERRRDGGKDRIFVASPPSPPLDFSSRVHIIYPRVAMGLFQLCMVLWAYPSCLHVSFADLSHPFCDHPLITMYFQKYLHEMCQCCHDTYW